MFRNENLQNEILINNEIKYEDKNLKKAPPAIVILSLKIK